MRWFRFMTPLCITVAVACVCVAPSDVAGADVIEIQETSRPESVTDSDDQGEKPLLRLPVHSVGSPGVWGDRLVFRRYRIQQRIDRPEECRLLNPNDIVERTGSYEACSRAFEQIRSEQELSPLAGEVTLLIHGILRHSRSLGKLATAVDEAGLQAEPFDYPSTKATLEQAVGYLDSTLKNFGPEVTKINVIVHSMGGLLVRAYLRDVGENYDRRLNRFVMLGTPNNGAKMATLLRNFGAFQMVFGPAGQQLVDAEDGVAATLPTPPFEFAVIAGSGVTDRGWNPLIPGDDDGTVTVESTRLPGATDFQTYVTTHALMLYRRDIAEAAVRFLKTGSLHEDGHCDPVVANEVAEPTASETD